MTINLEEKGLFIISQHVSHFAVCVGICFSLSGCMGVYEGGFECPPGKGVGCKSISEVNTMVDQGEIPQPSTVSLPLTCQACAATDSPKAEAIEEESQIWYAPRPMREPLSLLIGKP